VSKQASNTIETESLDHLVNIDQFTTLEQIETEARLIATTLDRITGKVKEQTITGKTNVGLLIWRACKLAAASDDKVVMPDVKIATIGKLSKLIGLSDDPGKRADGTRIPDAADRFGYKMGTLGACVDLARGVIAGVDQSAREYVLTETDALEIDERNLRSAILFKLNPQLKKNRAKGAESLAAAKLALAAGKSAGETVKVGGKVDAKGKVTGGKVVKIDAEMLNKVKNEVTDATLTDAAIAAMTDAQIAANIKKLQLAQSARAAGTIKAPTK